MKQSVILFFFLLCLLAARAQQRAVTGNGDEVILNQDGTWKYVNDSLAGGQTTIDTSKQTFSRQPAATFLVKSSKVDVGIYLDPKKWSFEKKAGQAAEFEFSSKTKDLYGMFISEKIEIPMATLKLAALKNAGEAAPDIHITKEEYRYVNNMLVLLLKMDGTISGIKFTYWGYYYSSPKGTVQLLTYTSANLVEEYKNDIETFLNGFTRIL
ncbi:MAG: hypothetical protein ABIU63_14650 [Chitinophagaceae bacterium]